MLKNKIWLGIFLSIILLIFSINGFAAYYKYTQESGDLFYVGTGDKADALEDTNEMRQIIDDLGALLFHSKRDGVYPKGGDFGGTIQIPEAGLNFSNAPENNDIAAYIAGEMMWKTKAELGIDLSLYYLKTEIDTLGEVETIYSADITDSTELATALTSYYLKTAIDTIGEVETIWIKDITDSDELAAALTDYYLKTAIDSQGEVETIWGVTLATDSELNTALADYYLKTAIDTLGKLETIYTKDIIDSDELAVLKFTDLADTPANYEGQAGKYVKVNAGETDLEFGTPTGGAGTYLELDDTPAAYDNGKYAKSTADGVVWDTPAGAGTVTTSGTPEVNDIARFTGATVIEGLTYDELTTALALNSNDLSDVASIAMLDEEETITNWWTIKDFLTIAKTSDTVMAVAYLRLIRDRDGDPTRNVSSGDYLGEITFEGYHTDEYYEGARIFGIVDGTPGEDDMPGRLEFWTTPDGEHVPVRRQAIDNAGNIKMGDGGWTDFINIDNAGLLSFEGAASVKTVPFDALYDNGNSGATPTINWQNGNYQKIAVSENTLFTFSNAFLGTITLVINYSGDYTAGFNAGYTIREAGGVEVEFTETNGAEDQLSIRHLGTANTYTVGILADVKD